MDMIECEFVKHNIPNGLWMRLIYRSVYVSLVAFVAVSSFPLPSSHHVCHCHFLQRSAVSATLALLHSEICMQQDYKGLAADKLKRKPIACRCA